MRTSTKNNIVCFGSQKADLSTQSLSHNINDTVLSVDPSATSKLRHVKARPFRVITLRVSPIYNIFNQYKYTDIN